MQSRFKKETEAPTAIEEKEGYLRIEREELITGHTRYVSEWNEVISIAYQRHQQRNN